MSSPIKLNRSTGGVSKYLIWAGEYLSSGQPTSLHLQSLKRELYCIKYEFLRSKDGSYYSVEWEYCGHTACVRAPTPIYRRSAIAENGNGDRKQVQPNACKLSPAPEFVMPLPLHPYGIGIGMTNS